ncbi:uncharacterized protein [Neodiprion pinetum]|uniref:uncharacterized protein isoform X1 n=2 Tax=Neodiprion pinetum TaxID=441929 RepID=UPI001EDDA72E|nr:uncharacterized protein LOC124220864 isoform X1 [Neodiprion pinetum]XP_046486185.1 uncharacterized protein LOC124220864 isoform X1 [Neodiprion pinetum]
MTDFGYVNSLFTSYIVNAMEVSGAEKKSPPGSIPKKCCQLEAGDLNITSTWKIVNDKLLHNTISTTSFKESSGRAELEDVVSLETCIRLEGNVHDKREPCNIDIKLNNGKKIARIAIVSEAFLIELYKQFGEYVSTAHAEFIDEFEQSAVYFADICLSPPTPEVSIKFARLKNPSTAMWLYGIRLSLTDSEPSTKSQEFDYNVIGELLQSKAGSSSKSNNWAKKILEKSEAPVENLNPELDSFYQNFMGVNLDSSTHIHFPHRQDSRTTAPRKQNVECIGDSADILDSNFKTYVDNRLREMEERLAQRIDTINYKTNEKLDDILKLLSNRQN